MLFAPDARPDRLAIRALAEGDGAFAVSLDPAVEGGEDANWLELLVNGLTFDVTGLAPGAAAGAPPIAHAYGLGSASAAEGFETVTLRPGPHLAGGGTMLPVVRMLALLTARLTTLPGVRSVVWHPARCASAPAAFASAVSRWVDGGPFPAFSLAALAEMPDEALQSEGLALFTGQELRIEPALSHDRAAAGRIAVRLMHWLVETGPLTEGHAIEGPSGERLLLTPSANGAFACAGLA